MTNHTKIRYKNLLIPSCRTCNNNALGKVERRISKADTVGYDAFVKLDEITIFQWLAKIYYGLLFKDLCLKKDIKKPKSKAILTIEEISAYRTLHFMLQSTRHVTKIHGNNPWSLFLFEIENDQNFDDFNFGDLSDLGAFIRFGKVGIICALEDNGQLAELLRDEYSEYSKFVLTVPQFDEFVAQVFYALTLQDRTPKFISVLPGKRQPLTIIPLPLQGMSSKPVYREWDYEIYSRYLFFFWSKYDKSLTFDQVYGGGDKVLSMLVNLSKKQNDLQTDKPPHSRNVQ